MNTRTIVATPGFQLIFQLVRLVEFGLNCLQSTSSELCTAPS